MPPLPETKDSHMVSFRTRTKLMTIIVCTGAVSCSSGTPLLSLDADIVETDSESDGDTVDPILGRPEACNGADDDLDGRVDEGCPIRISDDGGHDIFPTIDGNRVAWVRIDERELHMGSGGELWYRELPDGPEIFVEDYAIAPRLSGDRVAFLGDSELVVVSLPSLERTVVVPDGAGFLQAPFVEGDLLAWSQLMAGTEENYEVFVHNLSDGQTTRVTDHHAIQEFPVVEGSRVAWHDDRLGHHTINLLHLFDVFVADISSPYVENIQVTEREGDVQIGYLRAFDDGRVFLTETEGPHEETFSPKLCEPVIYDVDRSLRTAIAPQTLECFAAWDLSGSRAVVEYDPGGVSDLWIIDVDTQQRVQVTDYARRSTRAQIDGDILVWQDDRRDNWDVYMMDLSDMDDGDFFPEGRQP